VRGRARSGAALLLGALLAGAPRAEPPAPSPAGAEIATTDPAAFLARQEPDLPPVHLSQPAFPGMLPRRRQGFVLSDGDIVLDLGLTSRWVGRWSDLTSDQDFYQYVSAGLRPVPLGRPDPTAPAGKRVPTVGGAFLFRFAQDVNGSPRDPLRSRGADPFRDVLDAELDRHDFAPRVFTGYLEANDLVPGSRLRVGRQYVFHTGAYQLDGGEVTMALGERAEAYAYGGAPVSYFTDRGGTVLAGAGGAVRPWPRGRVEIEYTHAEADSEQNDLVTLAAEQRLARGVSLGARFRELGTDPWDVSLRLGALLKPLATTARFRYRQVLSDIHDAAFPVAPLTAVLGPERRLVNVMLELTRPVTTGLEISGGAQAQEVPGPERFATRDYQRIFGRLDLLELPWRGAFVTPSIDHWRTGNEETTGFGVRWTQVVSSRLQTWVGTDHARFLYDYLRREQRENVRLYYAGALWRPHSGVDLAFDFEAEDNAIPTGEDPLYTLMAWVTCALP
jgi:hypothetical protein